LQGADRVQASILESFIARAGAGSGIAWHRPTNAAGPARFHRLAVERRSAEAPAARIDCGGDEVEVWIAPHDDHSLASTDRLLAADDWKEIDGVRHAGTRTRMIAARSTLRTALSRLVGQQVVPTAWRFARTALGRPYIVHPELRSVHFSVSHSDGLSVIAVSPGRPVGIDVEAEHSGLEDEFVRSFLSRREWSGIQFAPEAQRRRDIIRLWTLKEAYTKLLGIGITADLKGFEFELDPLRLVPGLASSEQRRPPSFHGFSVDGPRGRHQLALAVGCKEGARA
jgi:4'-phosphopantetheinyl transferase